MERTRRTWGGAMAVLVAGVVLLSFVTVPVAAAVEGEPDLSVVATENRIAPGETAELRLSVVNAGDVDENTAGDPSLNSRVTTARGTRLTVEAGDAPVEVRSGTLGLGSVPEGSVQASVRLHVDEDAEPGTYTLPVTASYRHTSSIETDSGEYSGRSVDEELSVEIRVTERPRFAVVSVETNASVGGSGQLELTLRNDGPAAAPDATVALESGAGGLTFGNAATTRAYVGDWPAGETRTVRVESAFAGGAEERPYPVEATVSYTDEDGNTARARPVTVGVTPAAEQTFAVTDREATLRVGEDGELSGTVVNEGPAAVEDAVLVLEEPGTNVDAAETEYALEDLAPGESAPFAFDVEVSSSARNGPRQFTYHVRYEGTDGETRESDPIRVRADVQPERDVFDVEPREATFEPGGSGRLVVAVTNEGEAPLTDVSAKLFGAGPVSADDDEAFVSELAPGETTEVVFGVSVSGGAMEKTYPVSMDFQYTEPDGDTKLSDSYRLPVTVEDSGGGWLPFGVGLGATAGAGMGAGAGLGLGVGAAALVVAAGGIRRLR